MFSLFRKAIHEPIDLQRQDLLHYPAHFPAEILAGDDCDQVSGGHGDLGSLTNPIPVNGAFGEIKYLVKLRGKTEYALFFHRAGITSSPATSNRVDIYEVVCLDGTQWNTLHFDMYHPRRSSIAPNDYSLTPYENKLGMDIPIGFGVNSSVENFPFGIPGAIERVSGSDDPFARRARGWLGKAAFSRPKGKGPAK